MINKSEIKFYSLTEEYRFLLTFADISERLPVRRARPNQLTSTAQSSTVRLQYSTALSTVL